MTRKYEAQKDTFSCGAHSFRNCMGLLGICITLAEAKELCNTKSYAGSARQNLLPLRKMIRHPIKSIQKWCLRIGTDEKGIKKGLRKLKLKFQECETENESTFLKFLSKSLERGRPVILWINYTYSIDDSGHWVVLKGKIKNYFIVIDSVPLSGSVVKRYTKSQLLQRFWWTEDEADWYYYYYGIAVYRNT